MGHLHHGGLVRTRNRCIAPVRLFENQATDREGDFMSAQKLESRDTAISDELLVEQICKGHPELFDLLYDRFFPRVYRFVERRLSNRADAE